jgi:hypothetical protein
MKKYVMIITIAMAASAFAPPSSQDNRELYLGEYNCVQIKQSLNEKHDGLSYTKEKCTLSVMKDETESVLQIKSPSGLVKVKLEKNIMYPYQGLRSGGNFYAEDSIYFKVIPGMGPFSSEYRGVKKK